jgi:hypothetical protein
MRQTILTDFYHTTPSKTITWSVYIGDILSSIKHYVLPSFKTSNHANLIQTEMYDYYHHC